MSKMQANQQQARRRVGCIHQTPGAGGPLLKRGSHATSGSGGAPPETYAQGGQPDPLGQRQILVLGIRVQFQIERSEP